MKRNPRETLRGAGRRTLVRRALPLALLAPLAGCDLDRVLDVPDPEVATPGAIQGAAALPVILAGAQGDFQLAFGGSSGSEGLVSLAGLFTDELKYTSTFPTRIEVDRREISITNSTMEPIHRNLQRARASAERAFLAYEEHQPNHVGRASALNLHGYSYVLMAEHYCSGVPFSRITDTGATEYGAPQTTQQMFEAALQSFDAALAAAGGTAAPNVAQQNLARVGRGRALLNLGRFADAAAAVRDVPTSFVFHVEHSQNSARQQNANFVFQHLGRRWAVADRQGTNGLPFRSAQDPRVPWRQGTGSTATGFDNSTMYLQLKYPGYDTPVVLASGVEARLIEAEAALRAGGNWLETLNALRAAPPAYYPASRFPEIGGMAPLADPGSEAARVELLFRERAFWMYLTGHRLGDLRRLVRQYGRTPEQVFPVGEYGPWHPDKGGEHGPDVNFPVPFDELNNPQFEGCINRNA